MNVKCDPEWLLFWRNAFETVIPAFHLNKKHWNSIILDGSIPDKDVQIMIGTVKYSKVKINYNQLSYDQVRSLEYALGQMKKRETEMLLLF